MSLLDLNAEMRTAEGEPYQLEHLLTPRATAAATQSRRRQAHQQKNTSDEVDVINSNARTLFFELSSEDIYKDKHMINTQLSRRRHSFIPPLTTSRNTATTTTTVKPEYNIQYLNRFVTREKDNKTKPPMMI